MVEYVRYRIDPRLAEILGRLHGTPIGQALADRLTLLADVAGDSPTGAACAGALRAHQWLLDRAADYGLALTSAGYLKPADLKALAAEMPAMSDWIFSLTREVHAQPVLRFRQHVTRTGLLRKYKGALVVTKAGAQVHKDPSLLWTYLAEHLVPTRPAFDEFAWILIRLHFATNDGERVDTEELASVLGTLGWAHDSGKPVLASDVQWVVNDAWAALANVGASVSELWHRRPSPEATALVRDALLTKR
ncbi:MAG: hypothetical protein ACTHJH_08510 [Marmoricola sp.]